MLLIIIRWHKCDEHEFHLSGYNEGKTLICLSVLVHTYAFFFRWISELHDAPTRFGGRHRRRYAAAADRACVACVALRPRVLDDVLLFGGILVPVPASFKISAQVERRDRADTSQHDRNPSSAASATTETRLLAEVSLGRDDRKISWLTVPTALPEALFDAWQTSTRQFQFDQDCEIAAFGLPTLAKRAAVPGKRLGMS